MNGWQRMKTREPVPRRLTGLMVALAMIVSGCALSFGYRHADWLISRQLDHYLDLTSNQRGIVNARLQPLLLRHRLEALPQYEQFLIDVQSRVGRGLTPADVEWTFASYDHFRADLFERAIPEGSQLIALLKDKQIRYLERVFRTEEAQAERQIQGPAALRLEERTKKGLSLAEDWLGSLSREQSSRLRELILALPDSQPVWWGYRRQRHEELLALLRSPLPPDQMVGTLRKIFVHPDQSTPAAYLSMTADMRAALTRLVLELDRMLTPVQRRYALRSIQKVIDDLHALARS